MRGMILMIAVAVSLALVPDAAAGKGKAVDDYGCDGPIMGKGKDIVGAETIDNPLTLLRRDWEVIGSVGISGVIGCDGRLHNLELDKQLPDELAARLRADLGNWRFEPANLKGKPVPTIYSLTLNPRTTTGEKLGVRDAAGKYGCGEPIKADGEEVKRPKRIRYSRILLSASELEKWGPIRVTGMIGCDGRVHDVKLDKQLPEKLEAKLRKKIGKSRYEPATLAGEPVAVNYNLTLNRPTTARR